MHTPRLRRILSSMHGNLLAGFLIFGSCTIISAPPTFADDGPRPVELSIERAIQLALAHNLGLQIEQGARQRAREEIAIAGSVFDPLFTTNYTNSKFRSPTVDTLSGVGGGGPISVVTVNPFVSQSFDFGLSGLWKSGATWSVRAREERGDSPQSSFFGINPRNSTSIRGDVTQPLLRSFGYEANLTDLRLAENSDLIAEHRFGRLLETTIATVHQAYWDLVFAIADLDVKRQNLVEANELLQMNREKVAVGTAKEIDVVDAEANIETQKSGIIESENILKKAQDTLLDLLNYKVVLTANGRRTRRALYEDITITPTSEFDPKELELSLEAEIGSALQARQDLRQVALELENAELQLAKRANLQKPKVDLVGSWTQQGLEENIGNSADELFSGRFYDWSIGVRVEYPLGNRLEKALYRQAEQDLATQKLLVEQLENSVILEVTQAVRDIRSAFQKVQTTQAASRLRKEQLQGEQERLRVGSSTSYQVLQVQNDLLEAQVQEVRARVDYKLSLVALESAAGRILTPDLLP